MNNVDRQLCKFCKSNLNVTTKLESMNNNYNYCSNCKHLCKAYEDKLYRSQNVLSFEKFDSLTKDVNIPNYLNVLRSTGNIETNWYFIKYTLKDDFFLKFIQGKWIALLTNGVNIKQIPLDLLQLYNPDIDVNIIKRVDNYMISDYIGYNKTPINYTYTNYTNLKQ